jgi:hypothetical protein
MSMSTPAVRTLLLAAGTLAAAVLARLATPYQQAIPNVGVLLVNLVPFALATETVASVPPAWFDRWRLRECVLVGMFAVVFCWFAPHMFDRAMKGDFDHFYDYMRTLMPLLIVALVTALRLGGGRPGTVRRVAWASILVMLSGLEDALFWVWRGQPVPARWDWAYHITVVLGHVASRTEAYTFIAVHLAAAVAVVALPDLFWCRLSATRLWLGRFRTEPAPPAAPDVPAGATAVGGSRAPET